MNLNRRQRSRSESRGAEVQHFMRFKVPHHQQQQLGARRKTSAELISEAKSLLNDTINTNNNHSNNTNNNSSRLATNTNAGGSGLMGVRLVSTRRPVTPREAGRALYGNVTLAGRPPSAFSMRYLQHENQRITPKTPTTLAPIYAAEQLEGTPTMLAVKRHGRRSHSLGSTVEFCKAFGGAGLHHSFDGDNGNGRNLVAAMPRKLPALEMAGHVQCQDNAANKSNAQKTLHNNKNQSEDALKAQQDSLLSSRRLLKRSCDVLSQSTTQKLIELLKEHTGLKDCTEETASHVHSILAELYGRVRKQEKHCKRGFILGGLYGLVESTSPKILLAVAKVVLALRVTGSNLTGACKLIFKVARSEQNDHLFHDNDLLELLIEGLGRASPLDEPEACIYGYGAIRFLTSSSAQERDALTSTVPSTAGNHAATQLWDTHALKPSTAPAAGDVNGNSNLLKQREQRWQRLCKQNTLVQRMARQGAVQLMVLHLQLLNEAGAARKLSGPPLHSLYQLAAALRALADVRQTSAAAAAENGGLAPDGLQLQLACAHLVRAAEISIGELEVQANIVRTLSVLSEDEECCLALVSATGRIGMLLGPCCELFENGGNTGAADNKPLSVLSRLGYILGNLMAKYDQARLQFFSNDVAMEFLLNALTLCGSKPLTLRSTLGDSVLDVLVKLIRVVANMSVNAEVGSGLGGVRDLGALLIALLQTINGQRQHGTSMRSSRLELQELTHATLGALHNLCFYQDDDEEPVVSGGIIVDAQQSPTQAPGCLQRMLPQLANALYATLRTTTDDTVQLEAERVLGNLTRNALARQHFCRSGGMSLMLQRLAQHSDDEDTDELETRACAIGVLVNLLGDEANRAPFLRLNGMQQLLCALNVVLQQRDWRFAAIICQAFWNLLTDITTTAAATTTIVANRIECGTELLDELCDQLADHLDEEVQTQRATTTDTAGHGCWEEFAVVAADLLERLQQSMDEQQHNSSDNNGNGNDSGSTDDVDDDDDDDEADVCMENL